jgi:hypothetical protein
MHSVLGRGPINPSWSGRFHFARIATGTASSRDMSVMGMFRQLTNSLRGFRVADNLAIDDD